jgi:hypothetical protein
MSSSGQYRTACSDLYNTWFSKDYGGSWSQYASFEGPDSGDQSGYSVSLSADGNAVAVGAPNNDGANGADSGSVRVYDWNGTDYLKRGTLDIDGESSYDQSGFSVSLSSDGTTVAVGSPLNDGSGNLTPNSGSVRLYKVDVTNAVTYTSSNSNVAEINGNLLIIKGVDGSSNITSTQSDTTINGVLTVNGTSYTLVYTIGSGGSNQTSTITSALSTIIPPPGFSTLTYGSSWSQKGSDIDGEFAGDQSGYSVSMSTDGSVVAVGAPYNYGATGRDSGQVRVYYWNGADWAKRGSDIDGDAGVLVQPTVVTASTWTTSSSSGWNAIGISSTGQYQTAGKWVETDIYTSSDYGVTWIARGMSLYSVNGVSISGTGQYQSFVTQHPAATGSIYTSNNYGETWIKNTQWTGQWYGISISMNGKYQTAVDRGVNDVTGGYIYTSVNYGRTFENQQGRLNNTPKPYNAVSMSGSGMIQAAVWGRGENEGDIVTSYNYGLDWYSRKNGYNWTSISVSKDGMYQSATQYNGNIYTSENYGQTWTPRNAQGYYTGWTSISISGTGQYQAAIGSGGGTGAYIYVSDSYGVNWNKLTEVSFLGNKIAMSIDGKYLTAAQHGNSSYLWFSREGGTAGTWTRFASYEVNVQEGDRSGTSVSLSGNGNTVAIGSPYYDLSGILNRGQVRVYDWSGTAWGIRGTNIMIGEGANDYSGMSVSLSSNGKIVAIGAPFNDGSGNLIDSGHVRVYAWSGTAWAQRGGDIDGEYGLTNSNRIVTASGTFSIAQGCYGISISSSGQYQTVVGYDSQIWISSNYGVTWRATAANAGSALNWSAVGVSSSGQYQTAAINDGEVWTSVNYGNSWVKAISVNKKWRNISISSTGKYQVASNEDTVYFSSNYGNSFNILSTGHVGIELKVAISSTGQYISLCTPGGVIRTSSDFGASYLSRMATNYWSCIAMSATGQYQTAGIAGTAMTGGQTGRAWVSSNFGVDWVENQTIPNSTWSSISISSTGQYQLLTPKGGSMIMLSSDFGNTWTQITISGIWMTASMSSSGQYQSVISNSTNTNNITFSRDYGKTWNTTASYEIANGDQSGYSVSLSPDGNVVAIGSPYNDGSGNTIDSGQVRVYAWSGSAWVRRGAVDTDGKAINDNMGYSVSLSVDGTVMAIGAPFGDGTGNVIDSGYVRVYNWNSSTLNWDKKGSDIEGTAGILTPPTVVTAADISPTESWVSISMSSTGQYQTAVTDSATGKIWVSSDYGVTWAPKKPNNNFYIWSCVAVSSSGQYQTAGVWSGNIWRSENYGMSWSPISSYNGSGSYNSNWQSICMSSSGKYQALVVEGGSIWNSSDYGNNFTSQHAGHFISISMSSTGQYQTTLDPTSSKRFISYDFGVTWSGFDTSLGSSSPGTYSRISISSTGQYQYVAYKDSSSQNKISSDFGESWTTSTTVPNQNDQRAICVSSTGQYQTIGAWNGSIWTSSDFGVNFVQRTQYTSKKWRSITISSTGQYQTAAAWFGLSEGGQLYFSKDYGFTWSDTASYEVTTGGDQSGFSVSLSSDGTTVAVGAPYNDGTSGVDRGQVKVYGWNGSDWESRGQPIYGESVNDWSGYSVSLSSDGTSVAIGAPSNDGSGNLLTNCGSVRIHTIPVNNPVTYTTSNPTVADILGNQLIIKGVDGTSNITATQSGNTVSGLLTVAGSSYTLTYTMSATIPVSFIYYSKDYGVNWKSLTVAGSKYWSSVAISPNGSTISAVVNDTTGGIFTYTMPDDQYYRPPAIANSGTTTTSSVRVVTYGNSGTGAATDGYWVAGADAASNSLAYSSNGIDWTAVAGSKTGLFNTVNGVAYGADTNGTPLWVAVGAPFVGSVPGSTAYSIAYSYNMTTWTGVRNLANFTGQGNHVTYGQDEFGAGMWVAVGQGDGVLAANLGNSAFGNSNGTPNTTIFYSYDGANWAAATGAGVFSTSGTDVTWGVDASGVATWVATGVGYTDPLTGVFMAGGQVAHSTDGRVWTPIRAPTAILEPITTPLSATTRGSAMIAPPALKTGFIVPTYNNIWRMLGGDIDGEEGDNWSGFSVSMSADGTVVAIGATKNDGSGNLLANSGHVRVYKYNPNKTVAQMDQTLPGFGPAGWDRLGGDIDGEAAGDESGTTVSLSADGTMVAIGSFFNAGDSGNLSGHVRVYKYRAGKDQPQLINTLPTAIDFGPAGWDRLGGDIDGEVLGDRSGCSVSLSTDGTVVAIGSTLNNGGGVAAGQVRVYKYNSTKTTTPVKWEQLGADIDGELPDDRSGCSTSLSADGTVIAIGAFNNDGTTGTASDIRGHVRVYKYTPGKGQSTVQTDASFGPAGWTRLGADIDGEDEGDRSGNSVSLSADGTTVAIGAYTNDGTAALAGHVRVYKYTPGKGQSTLQTDASFGPAGWTRLGKDIDGEAGNDQSGYSVSLSADGTIVAIGANYNDGATTNTEDFRGHVRVYKYNPAKIAAITDQSLPNFGPAGWDRIGVDIDGEANGDQSGFSVSLSADGTTLAIGAATNDAAGSQAGHVRVYKLDTYGAITYTSSNPSVADIYGNSLLLINDISDGVTTITATQAAVPPFTLSPITVQGTLTVSGKTTRTLVYNTIVSTYAPFSTSALTVAYGRGGSQGTGVPRWIVGGSGTNVFAISSRPSATTAGTWSVVSSNDASAPFTVCNSLGYSNGIWVAGNNTDATNVLARSTDGGTTWTPVTLSSVSGVIAGATAVGANAFCNYSLAYADYSNDTNLRSWVAVQGTKNFMFEGGVNTVATVSSNINASAYNNNAVTTTTDMTTTTTIPSTVSVMVAPPGALTTTYGSLWGQLGLDISGNQAGEESGTSVSLSADGTTVAIGSNYYDVTGSNAEGRTRIYKYNTGTSSWGQLGLDISGTQISELSGHSVSLSADGTTVAIGSTTYDKAGGPTNANTDEGRVRIYKYNNGTYSWIQLGLDISGNQAGEQNGYSVSLSADGTVVAIGSYGYDVTGTNNEGRVRIYKYNNGTLSWGQLGLDISGTQISELSGYSVSLSADGTTVAIGSAFYDVTGTNNEGRVRVYKYTNNTGTYSWGQLGLDICGNQVTEQSGWSVSLSADGTTVAIGSNNYDVTGTNDAGRTRIYKYNKNGTYSWDQLGLDISGNQAGERSGYSVSLSADGTTVAIGSVYYDVTGSNNEGRTRIYKYNNVTLLWDPLGTDISGNQMSENSGYSVSLSADGTTVAIGSRSYDKAGGPTNANTDEGRVRVYKIPTTNAVTYTSSNSSVADIYGNLLLIKGGTGVSNIVATQGTTTTNGTLTVVGTTYSLTYPLIYSTTIYPAWWVAGGVGASSSGVSGAALACTTAPSGATGWTKSTSSDIANLASINDVAFSPHTQRWLAVGAGAAGSTNTNVLYSDALGTSWNASSVTVLPVVIPSTVSVMVAPTGAVATTYGSLWGQLGLDISGTQANEESGYSVSLSADGTTVAIGSNQYDVTGTINIGRTRIYKYNKNGNLSWDQLGLDISSNQAQENSGYSVSLSADGTTVAIGSAFYDVTGTTGTNDEGRVRIYKYNNGTSSWAQLGLDISGTQISELSGYSVSLSADGTTVAIGSVYYDTNGTNTVGRVRIYKYNKNGTSSWDQLGLDISGNQISEQSGYSVSLSADGTTVAIGSIYYDVTVTNNEGRTRIYKYNKNGTYSWIQLGLDISGNQISENSGYSVSLSADGTTVAIGSRFYNVTGTNYEGRVRVYKYNNGTLTWGQLGLDISGTQLYEQSGQSVSLSADGTTVAIGSYNYDVTGANDAGRTRIYKYNKNGNSSWDQLGLDISGNQVSEYSGYSVSLSADGTTVAIGSYLYDKAGGPTNAHTDEGRVRVYKIPTTNQVTYTSSNSSVADIYGNLLIIKGVNGSSNIVATQGSTITTGTLTVSGTTTYRLVYGAVGISITLNTCIWNQLDASASATGRWLAGGTRNDISTNTIPTSASLYISTDASGAASPWTPITGTGAILSQVYSIAYNGRVWIAAGVAATDVGSTSTLMRTTDPTGASGWQGITSTNVSTGGFDTAARSIAWNADQQMWVSTGENTSATDSSVIYSQDVSGSAGTWRSVRESNSLCFSGEGTGIAFTGDKWFASGQGTNQIVATAGTSAASAATGSWTSIAHGTALTSASDIAYTGRRLIATGASTSGTSNGVFLSTDNSGGSWSAAAATPGPGFTDAAGGATSITFEASYDGVGRAIATGRSATNTLSVSTDGGTTWAAPSVQYSSTYLYENYGPITARTTTVGFPVLNSLPNWIIDISFIVTGGASTYRPLLGSMYNSVDTGRGWGIWVGHTNQIHYSHNNTTYDSFVGNVTLNVGYNLNVTKVGTSVTLRLTTVSTQAVLTNTITVTDAMGLGPVDLYGFSNGELFIGTIGYVIVTDYSKSAPSATTQPLFTTGGNSVAYVGNDTIFSGGGNDVQWTGKRWVATGRTSGGTTTTAAVSSTASGSAPLPDIINNNTSAVATSDDGITWQCVSSSQAPNLSEGTFLASNSRIGATPLINSQIAIADGGDTEATVDYGGMVCDTGGSGTGVAQIDIIAELTPVSNAASSVVSGAVNILGAAGNGGANGVGNAPAASFDNTAFTITTRPI